MISFLVPLCYNGLNSIAIELEEPFGTDDNDVDLDVRAEEFMWMMVDTLRARTYPPDSGGMLEERIRRNTRRGMEKAYSRRKPEGDLDIMDLPFSGELCYQSALTRSLSVSCRSDGSLASTSQASQ